MPARKVIPRDRVEAVIDACRLIERSETPPNLDSLARAARLSRFHFHRLFKSLTGVTPKAYGAAHRADRLRRAMSSGGSVTQAFYAAGFGSSGRFYENAQRLLGMPPAKFRAGGDRIAIRFAIGQCSLGAILVAATDRGLCAIQLGDDPERLVRELQDRFTKATLIGGDEEFERWVARVVGFVEGTAPRLDLPLDIRATAFQQRVWQSLLEIPAGSTVTYSELARRIGRPMAARAVAQACGANPLAVAIPCHRVVRNDGSLGGYRWGIERKRILLDREACYAHAQAG